MGLTQKVQATYGRDHKRVHMRGTFPIDAVGTGRPGLSATNFLGRYLRRWQTFIVRAGRYEVKN